MERISRIFVDERIPHALELFSQIGRVTTFDGLKVAEDPIQLKEAEILITRSVTRIGQQLLDTCPNLVAIASPTIGTDHVDFEALEEYRVRTGRLVPFFHAPGATAGGVADFTLACILLAARKLGESPQGWQIGIWGFGNCGSALARRLDILGIPWVAYDPPKQERENFASCTLDTLLKSDVLTLHVPLTTPRQSRWPTFHMVSEDILSRISGRTKVLINTSRGPVVDSKALLTTAANAKTLLCLDVWENEPTPSEDLVRLAFLATPHSAGSVIEGRLRSVGMVYNAIRAFVAPWAPKAQSLCQIKSQVGPFLFPERERDFLEAVGLEKLSNDFKRSYLSAPASEKGKVFDSLRVHRTRHEILWVEPTEKR